MKFEKVLNNSTLFSYHEGCPKGYNVQLSNCLTPTWDATSRNGKRHAWWPKCVVTPSPREIGAQLIAFWRFLLLIICTCTQQIFVRGGSAPRSNPLPVEKAFYICDWFLFYDSAGFQQLKGIQSSKQDMWKEYHLSIEGIRNREEQSHGLLWKMVYERLRGGLPPHKNLLIAWCSPI